MCDLDVSDLVRLIAAVVVLAAALISARVIRSRASPLRVVRKPNPTDLRAGVRDIESAVTSTLGVLQAAAEALGAPDPDTSSVEANLEEVKDYLEQFHVLLALDNFETLSQESLRALLSNVPSASKVLLTSSRNHVWRE